MVDCNPCATPVCVGVKLSKSVGVPLANPVKFRRLIGKLLYLTITRPNIMFGVQQLSQFLDSPIDHHWKCALRILNYLKGTQYYQLLFTRQQVLHLTAYSDAD